MLLSSLLCLFRIIKFALREAHFIIKNLKFIILFYFLFFFHIQT